jgi:hypothetical protein
LAVVVVVVVVVAAAVVVVPTFRLLRASLFYYAWSACRLPNFKSLRFFSVKHAAFIEYADIPSATVALHTLQVREPNCVAVADHAGFRVELARAVL